MAALPLTGGLQWMGLSKCPIITIMNMETNQLKGTPFLDKPQEKGQSSAALWVQWAMNHTDHPSFMVDYDD